MNNSFLNTEGIPYDHSRGSVSAACGVDLRRSGGVVDTGERVAERLSEQESTKTSVFVEAVEQLGQHLSRRELIIVAFTLGMAKGVHDAPHIIMDILKRRHEGEE